jgi:hypothetical protein
MRVQQTILLPAMAAILIGVSAPGWAQQVTIRTPYRTASDSFFENNSISWSGNWRGINFSYGGGALAAPPFGGYQPNAGLSANFGFAGKDGKINFATSYGAGYRQSFTSQTPSVTIMNGQTGYFSDTSQTPFVVSVVPVVGAFPVVPPMMPPLSVIQQPAVDPRIQAMLDARTNAQDQAARQAAAEAQAGGPVQPLPAPPQPNAPRQNKAAELPPPPPDPGDAAAERLNAAQQSTAGRPAPSVAEAKRIHQQEQAAANEELSALMVRAQALEEDGKPNVAKIYYQRIAKHATGTLQQQARQKLYELDAAKKP